MTHSQGVGKCGWDGRFLSQIGTPKWWRSRLKRESNRARSGEQALIHDAARDLTVARMSQCDRNEGVVATKAIDFRDD